MTTKPDTQAFPASPNQCSGLTKREYFAAIAMNGYLATENIGASGYPLEEVAKLSVQAADALIDRLNQK